MKIHGYKTYMAAVALLLNGVVSLLDAHENGGDYSVGINQLIEAVGLASIRHGIQSESNKKRKWF